MPDRFIPFTNLGKGTGLRFDRADIKGLELALTTIYGREIGYPEFTRPGIFGSLTSIELFVWRGMKEENEKGELVHTFPLTRKGSEEAGELVWKYIQDNTGSADLSKAITDAFIAAGPWFRRNPDAPEEKKTEEKSPKNSTT